MAILLYGFMLALCTAMSILVFNLHRRSSRMSESYKAPNESPAICNQDDKEKLIRQVEEMGESLRNSSFVKETHDLRAALHFISRVMRESYDHTMDSDNIRKMFNAHVPRLLSVIKSSSGIDLAKETASSLFSVGQTCTQDLMNLERRDRKMAILDLNTVNSQIGQDAVSESPLDINSKYHDLLQDSYYPDRYFMLQLNNVPRVIQALHYPQSGEMDAYNRLLELVGESIAVYGPSTQSDRFRFGEKMVSPYTSERALSRSEKTFAVVNQFIS